MVTELPIERCRDFYISPNNLKIIFLEGNFIQKNKKAVGFSESFWKPFFERVELHLSIVILYFDL